MLGQYYANITVVAGLILRKDGLVFVFTFLTFKTFPVTFFCSWSWYILLCKYGVLVQLYENLRYNWIRNVSKKGDNEALLSCQLQQPGRSSCIKIKFIIEKLRKSWITSIQLIHFLFYEFRWGTCINFLKKWQAFKS